MAYFAIYGICGLLSVLHFRIQNAHIRNIFNAIKAVFEPGKAYKIHHYLRAQRESDFILRVFIFALVFFTAVFMALPIMYVVYHQVHGDFQPKHMQLPLTLAFHGHGHVIGYAISYLFQIWGMFSILIIFVACDGFFIVCCLYAVAFVEDFHQLWQDLDEEFMRYVFYLLANWSLPMQYTYTCVIPAPETSRIYGAI